MTCSRLLEDREGAPWGAFETTLEQANEEGDPGWTSLASSWQREREGIGKRDHVLLFRAFCLFTRVM